MIRCVSWTATAGGKDYRCEPLTVRQRMMLSEDLSSERARVAAQDAALAGLSKSEAAEFIGDARRKGLAASALYLDAYTQHGAIRILTLVLGSVDAALDFAGKATPREATRVCLEALGIDTDTLDREETASSGNG